MSFEIRILHCVRSQRHFVLSKGLFRGRGPHFSCVHLISSCQFLGFSSRKRFPGDVTLVTSCLKLQSSPLAGPKFHLRMYCLVFIRIGGVICMNVAECVECGEWNRLFLCFEMGAIRE